MPVRAIPQDEVIFLIPNHTNQKVVVAGVAIPPGKVGRISARKVVSSWNRVANLAYFMDKLKVSAQFQYAKGGMTAVPMSSSLLLSMQAPSAGPLGTPPALAATSRPATTAVPVGYEVYNTTTNRPNFNTGAGYELADGTPA